MEETKLTGNLPNLVVEITHRAAANGSAEQMVINLTATPDFRAALPLVANLAQLPLLPSPLEAWSRAAEAWLAPWSALAAANPLLSLFAPLRKE